VKMRIGSAEKVLTEIRKGIVIGLLLTSFYGIGVYVYKNKNKNKTITKIEKKESLKNAEKTRESITGTIDIENQKDDKYEIYKGYKYKKPLEDEKTTFVKRNLGYEKRFLKSTTQEELDNGLKIEYCNAIEEIKKVDQKIVPGTRIPFKKATYIQVDDAYKEYLQKIAQIRQVVSNISPDNLDKNMYFEARIKCEYKGTYWNNDNSKYLVRDFYSKEVNEYYR
jgi:hypothetical protein